MPRLFVFEHDFPNRELVLFANTQQLLGTVKRMRYGDTRLIAKPRFVTLSSGSGMPCTAVCFAALRPKVSYRGD